ncbi:MAG: EamA family transporter [Verrucomicrobiaceae bacterium]|nr:MAG: EamA family transporter [Verrucomicrobiaceae bacterium]
MHAKEKRTGILLAVTAAVLWGVSGTFAQFLFESRSVGPEWLVSVRMPAAGLLMLLIFGRRGGPPGTIMAPWRHRGDAMRLILFSLLGMLAIQYTYFAAIRHSNAATATVLQFAGPVIIAVWLTLTRRRWPAPGTCAAILLAVAGTVLLVTHGRLDTLAVSPQALGWGLASAVALAWCSIQPVALLARHSTSVITGWAMIVGGTAFWLVHPPWRLTGVWDAPALGAMLFILVPGTLLPFNFYMSAIRLAGGQTASLLLSAEPLSATLTGVLWLKTPFGPMDWLGSACILAAVFFLPGPETAHAAGTTGGMVTEDGGENHPGAGYPREASSSSSSQSP